MATYSVTNLIRILRTRFSEGIIRRFGKIGRTNGWPKQPLP